MHYKKTAALLAAVFSLTCAAQLSASITSAESADSFDMNVSVSLSGEKKEISPYIFGINEYGNSGSFRNVAVNAVRQGGNRYTGYNWETNYSNAGHDWLHSSDTNIGDITDGSAYAAQKLSDNCLEYGIPYKLTTLQMAGFVAADKDGSVGADEAAPSSRWNAVQFRKNGELSLTPDLEDGTVYMDEYVNYLVNTLGGAASATGIQGYSLDNEPVLWNDTHPYIHADEVTNSELVSKSIVLASVVKEIDPDAEVFGPAFWGMLPCIQAGESGDGFTDPDWQAVKNNYFWYLDFYLEQMAQAEKDYGTRLLDVIDVHYYAQDCSTDEAILQAARSLYDPTYVENSWLQPYLGQYFPFIPNIKNSIDKYYPGTKIAVSEYNLANISDEKNTGKSVVSAIAEAEALGCFADNGVYLATYWGTLSECPYALSAINLYTNYDGKGSAFGDTLVEAQTEDISLATAFAAINGEDDSDVTMVLSNKDMSRSENAVISISGTDTAYKSATVYAITQDSSEIRVIDVQNNIENNTVTVELPPLSVAQVVISDEASSEDIYVEPDITTKEVVFTFDELELSENGFPMIPLGDTEHLTKAVINSTASCSSGAAWYGGGGALTFNKLVPNDGGDAFWGAKSFMYGTGTSDTTVTFDGFFTNGNQEEVAASIGDTYTEFQGNWWASSANDDKGADVSVTYNSITLYYEYDNTQSSSGNSDRLWGDADLSGEVGISDVVLVMSHASNSEKFTMQDEGKSNADVYQNGDGISVADALSIQKYLAQVITKLPES